MIRKLQCVQNIAVKLLLNQGKLDSPLLCYVKVKVLI